MGVLGYYFGIVADLLLPMTSGVVDMPSPCQEFNHLSSYYQFSLSSVEYFIISLYSSDFFFIIASFLIVSLFSTVLDLVIVIRFVNVIFVLQYF